MQNTTNPSENIMRALGNTRKVPSDANQRKEAKRQFTVGLSPIIKKNDMALRNGQSNTAIGGTRINIWAQNWTAYEVIHLQHKLGQEMVHDEDLVDRYVAIKDKLDISHLEGYKMRLHGIFDEEMSIDDLKNIGKRKRGENKNKTMIDKADDSSDSTSKQRALEQNSIKVEQPSTIDLTFEDITSIKEQEPSSKKARPEQVTSMKEPQPSSKKRTLEQDEQQSSTKKSRSDTVFDFGTLVENVKKGFVDLKVLDHALEFLGDVFAVSNAVTKKHIQDSCEKMWK